MVKNLQELTGRESGIVLYGRHGVMCNWSGMRGIPKEFATGLLDDFESIPVVEGVHVDDLTPYLDDADIDIMCNYDEGRCPLDGGTVYELGNGVLVITPDGWI